MEKPAALKTDENGNCITICRMGQLEYIHKLIHEDGISQQKACQIFIDAVNEHVNDGDPITAKLTVENVRSQFRRDSGKLKDKPKNILVEPTNKAEEDEILRMAAAIKEKKLLAWLAKAPKFVVRIHAYHMEHYDPESCVECDFGIDFRECPIRKKSIDLSQLRDTSEEVYQLIRDERPDCWLQ